MQRPITTRPSSTPWETVEVFGVRGMAEVAGSALRSADIPFRIMADDGGAAVQLPFSLRTRGIELQVPAPAAADARSLLGGRTVEFDALEMAEFGGYDEPTSGGLAVRRPHLVGIGRMLLAAAVVALVVGLLRDVL